MTLKGVDYSFARPGGAAIKAAGFDFVMRYTPYAGDQGKGLTIPERDDLRANGLDIGMVFETTAGRMFDGYPAGRVDAAYASQALAALGFPPIPIYFACDVDTTPPMLAYIDDYLNGVSDSIALARTGVYGEYDVVKHCIEAGTASWSWLTYAWSGGQVFTGYDVYQYLNGQVLNGGAVDYNLASGSESFWKAEEDMGMTPAELARLERLEKIVAGNGVDMDDDGTADTFGEDALAIADTNGWSAFLGVSLARRSIALHTDNHPGGDGITLQQLTDAIAEGKKHHKHSGQAAIATGEGIPT